jgi:hypothetical protein
MLADIDMPDPAEHPLATIVPDRTTTELLAWPIIGVPPRKLSSDGAVLVVGQGERNAVAASLRDVVDSAQGDEESAAMIRRQVKFLLAQVPRSQDWVADLEQRDLRTFPDLGHWTPQWAVARSAAITRSRR